MRILNGTIHVGHRPKLKYLRDNRYGYTHILTLLHKDEGALELGQVIKASGIKWMWLPLWGIIKEIDETLPHIKQFTAQLPKLLFTLESILREGGHVFIHCSAGIHRTGTVTAALLYYLGYSDEEVVATLDKIRPIIVRELGDRIMWARKFGRTK